MAGSRLQLLFLCYRDSGDSLLLKHNGHLSPRGVIQIQYQLKVIPILFSPALQHIYCCAVQLKALPGPGAARRAPVCASLPGGFGTLPGGYGVEEAGRAAAARPGSGPAAGAAGAPPLCPAEPRGPPAPPPRDALSAPRGNSEPRGPPGPRAARAAGGPPLARSPPPSLGATCPAPPRSGHGHRHRHRRGKRRQRAGIFPGWRGGICSQLRGRRSVRRGWGRSLNFSSFFFIFIIIVINIFPPAVIYKFRRFVQSARILRTIRLELVDSPRQERRGCSAGPESVPAASPPRSPAAAGGTEPLRGRQPRRTEPPLHRGCSGRDGSSVFVFYFFLTCSFSFFFLSFYFFFLILGVFFFFSIFFFFNF